MLFVTTRLVGQHPLLPLLRPIFTLFPLPSSCSLLPHEPISIRHPLLAALSSCRSPEEVRCLHARLVTSGLAATLSSPGPFQLPPQDRQLSLLLFRYLLRPFSPRPQPVYLPFKDADEGLAVVMEAEQVRGQAARWGLGANLFVCNVVIRLYGSWGMMEEAERVFKECSARDLFSWNSLMGGYVGVGEMQRARILFGEMRKRDVVSWSTVIAGYVQEGSFMEAMELFHDMQLSGVAPNEFTLTSILTACANLVALDQGRWVHSYINRAKINLNERLLAGLIDMYAKCGEINWALKVFYEEGISKRTVWPWNAMLGGFAIHGMAGDAVDLFERMRSERIAPNKVTFISLLSACSHGSFLDEGRTYFELMKGVYGIDQKLSIMAEEFISLMPISPDFIIWSALLNACRIHRNIDRAEESEELSRNWTPNRSGRWTGARDIRNEVEISGSKKTPGWSSIELSGMFHQFLVGDQSHPQAKQIYSFLDELSIKLKKAGYEPELGEVLVDIDEEDKETALSIHSEKLAIAFGLMNTEVGTVIRIVKNLRGPKKSQERLTVIFYSYGNYL
ncbi:unnamed protein product [Spirodela intermedia]|uniref:DYW domain-containing protein n=1 Tax=Spirodela intermedia TaxID=51605 RepID=A0A7I8IR30_SPIIN|nr:unnamed protein product [Spirodela intermedia]CAA6659622.1 unnamed protein product [Spirodela intermedia]